MNQKRKAVIASNEKTGMNYLMRTICPVCTCWPALSR